MTLLFKNTDLQTNFSVNMVAIADGKPKLLNLLEIISYYTQYQREVVVKRTKFELNVAKERAHILEGILVAIKNIDEVIKIIKKSATTSEAKQKLREKFNLSDRQAQAILDMKLSRLVHLEVNKIEEELKELKAKIKELEGILASKKLQYDVVKKEILEIKKNYNTPRRSVLNGTGNVKIETIDENAPEPAKNFVLSISAGDTIKKVSPKNYSMSQKTISDNTVLTDLPKQVETLSSDDTILIFTNQGNVIKKKVDELKECKWRDKGASLLSIEKSSILNEIPVCFMKVEKEGTILFMTKQGMVKKSEMADLVTTKSYYQVCKLSDGDEVLSVEVDKKGKSILMLSRKGMSLNFDKGEIPTQGRISGGVKGMNLDEGDSIIFASQVDFTHLVVVSENGYIKKIPATNFPLSQRYRKGLKYITFAKNAKNVFYACSANENITLAVDFGLKILALETVKIPEGDRLTSGNEIIKKNFFTINKMI